MNHVLEHLGQSTQVYLGVIRELYRVCAPGATIRIAVPHPRHDDFLADPSHVRPVTPRGLEFFSKAKNREWLQAGCANSTLALDLDVDFEIVHTDHSLDPAWGIPLAQGRITQTDVATAAARYNNVVKEIRMVLRVVKRKS